MLKGHMILLFIYRIVSVFVVDVDVDNQYIGCIGRPRICVPLALLLLATVPL
jgi:hypothetical protein